MTELELLHQIDNPKQLRQLKPHQLPQLADELRAFIIEVVSRNGGHLGASLGVIELTIALHYCYNTPEDLLLWDVGHQAYGHKILTERRERFETNRKKGGIGGFPRRSESIYDTFGVGHSSTSISAGIGMAIAGQLKGESKKVIAVAGDAALSAGMAFEGLNHAGVTSADFLLVLNDNSMSIDPSVGALNESLIKASKTADKNQSLIWQQLKQADWTNTLESTTKTLLAKEDPNFFEALGLRYFGPIDGHNLEALQEAFNALQKIPGPKVIHCLTKKGKGYRPAEEGNATRWHAPGLFDSRTGKILKPETAGPKPPKFQDVFGETLVELAESNNNIVGITPAMPSGSGMIKMMEAFPERTFDVGIAEQHAVTFAAGLATQGLLPFCAIYSTFMQRAYDQLIHDVAIQNLKVIFCLDRAGLVGEDGATHQGAYDLAYLRCIPNLVIVAPSDEKELRNVLYTAQTEGYHQSFAIRYPRGRGSMIRWKSPFEQVNLLQVTELSKGKGIAILGFGAVKHSILEALERLRDRDISVGAVQFLAVKPLNTEELKRLSEHYSKFVTVEDGTVLGGFGSAVAEWAAEQDQHLNVYRLGIPDEVIESASQQEQREACGIDATGITSIVLSLL